MRRRVVVSCWAIALALTLLQNRSHATESNPEPWAEALATAAVACEPRYCAKGHSTTPGGGAASHWGLGANCNLAANDLNNQLLAAAALTCAELQTGLPCGSNVVYTASCWWHSGLRKYVREGFLNFGCWDEWTVGLPCEDDGDHCTQDLCDESGECTHPAKTNPPLVVGQVTFSITKKFGKDADLPVIGNLLGVHSELSVKAKTGPTRLQNNKCVSESSLEGSALLRTKLLGQQFEVEGSAEGTWSCEEPIICPDSSTGRKVCDASQRCCKVQASGSLGLSRGFEKRWGTKFGSAYVNASLGAGVHGSLTTYFPHCASNPLVLTMGPYIKGKAGGGIEVCNWLTSRLCDCQQGRDPWTGKFQTACSSCTRCRPAAGASISGELRAAVTWTHSGTSITAWGKGCFAVEPIQLGPIGFVGYEACRDFGEAP